VAVRNIDTSALTVTADLDVGTRPFVLATALEINEASGSNNNGRVEPGEVGDIQLQLTNVYPTGGVNLGLAVHSLVTGANASTSIPLSIGGLSSDTLTFPGLLQVDQTFVPREVPFEITITSSDDTLRYTLSAVIGYPSILLVDRDTTSENIARYYRTAIDNYGAFHETFHTNGSSLSAVAPEKRNVIICFTGRRKFETLPDSVRQEMAAFLSAGGNLFVTGQNIAEELHGTDSLFLHTVLHANWTKNNLLGRMLYGVPGDPIGTQINKLFISSGNGASNQTSPDVLAPDSLAHPFLLYGSATSSTVGGVWHEDADTHGKIVFLGFGFEAINDSGPEVNSRQQVMKTILNWFYGITSAPGRDLSQTIPEGIVLLQNYPNPFNPSTQIQYSLNERSRVTLAIYDVLGREVRQLVNETVNAGLQTVAWDGTNAGGTPVASGVYLYRLTSAPTGGGKAYTTTRKMLLTR
jgi:hypothetical protein